MRKHNFVNKPGWSDYVDDLYKASRDALSLWRNAGQPRQGPLHELHEKTKVRFKYALRFITKNEKQLRKEALAKKLTDLNPNAFCKEIKLMNLMLLLYLLILTVLKIKDILNCLRKNSEMTGSIDNSSTAYDDIYVTEEEVESAIKDLESKKSCGADGIYAEHLKYASIHLLKLLSCCLTCLFVHGILPDSMISVILVPVIKNKAGKITSKDNYRPIALASLVSKVVEIIILHRLSGYLLTNLN